MSHRGNRIRLLAIAGVALGAGAVTNGMTLQWTVAVALGGPIMAWVGSRVLRAASAAALSRSGVRSLHYRPSSVDLMSGVQFEDYVAEVIRSCGVPVIMTPPTGDWGVDLIVGRRPNRIAIQCKRSSKPIGPGAVQEVVAGAPMQGCTRTMVVSNQEFTPAARQLAGMHGCILVGGSELRLLRHRIRGVNAAPGTA